jgi:hypothetical protein
MPDPLWINCPPSGGPQYTAAELRQDMAFGGMWGGRSMGARQGVRPGGTQWNVTLSGTTITVWAGVGIVDPGLSQGQGPYWVALPADETAALVAAHATSPRKDIVVVRVYDTDEDGSGLRLARSEYIPGVAAPSPSEPAVPAGSVKVATIDVPAQGGGSPVVTMNSPYTVAPGGVLPVRNVTELTGVTGYPGMAAYVLDGTGLVIWSGSAWVLPVNLIGAQTAGMAGKKVLAGRSNIQATNAQTHSTTTVSFGTTFASVPVVTICHSIHPPNPLLWHLESAPTTTQFTVAIMKYDLSTFGSTVQYPFDWIAVG